MENSIFNYNGNKVTFINKNDVIYINATQMAQEFGKTTKDWLRTEQSDNLLKSISKRRLCLLTDLVIVKHGGANRGTWMQEDIALLFAQWLSPDFYLWCNDRIKEMIKHGFTATPGTLEEMINNPDFAIGLLTSLKKEREEKELLQQTNDQQVIELKQSAPKVKYYNNVLQSGSLIATSVIASELGISAVALNKKLRKRGVIFQVNGTWVLYRRYKEEGYTGTKTHSFTDSTGNKQTKVHLYWTEKGREFIHNLYKPIAS